MTTSEHLIRTYIAENILFSNSGYPYSDDASFLDEGIVDSMNVLQIVTFVEKQFGIHINDEDIVPNNFDSVAKLAAYVQSRLPTAVSTEGEPEPETERAPTRPNTISLGAG
jgi:acyl carrier protein